MYFQNQANYFFKGWTFFRCFYRDLRELKQNNKFDTDQLFYYILNIQRMCLQTNQVVPSKYGLSLDVLTQILESWSRRTNLTLTNYFITYLLNIQRMRLQTSQVVPSKYGLSLDVLTEILESWSRITNLIVHRQKLFLRERNHIFTKFVTIPFINKTA